MGGVLTGTVAYTDSTGAVWPFVYTGSVTATAPYTAYTVPAGQPWQLATSPTAGYTLTDFLTGEAWRFDAQGRSLSDTDSYGNQDSLTQGASGPTSEANSGGRSLAFSYQSGQLADAQSPLWQSGGATAAGSQHVAYGYNASGQLTARTQGAGTTDAVTATFGYSGTQLVTVTTPYTGYQQTWTLGYDAAGRVGSITSPISETPGQAGYTPAYTTQFSYLPGQTQVVPGYGTTAAETTTYTLDGQGQAVAVADALGHSTQTSYDQDHDVLSSTDANGHTTTNAYEYVGPTESTGLVTQTVQPAIAPYSPLNTAFTPITTTHTYDPTSYDLTETDLPEGGIERYAYDGHHSVVTSTETINPTDCEPTPCAAQWRGSITRYDQYGEQIATTDGRGVTVTSSGIATLTDPHNLYTHHWGYDSQGNEISSSTPVITTTLNGITTTAPVTTSYGDDGDGNQTTMTSPNGQTITDGYDHLGRQISARTPQITLYDGSKATPVASIGYDGDGNVVRQTDANGNTTTDSYDPLGRLVADANPVSGTTIMTYSATELVAQQDPQGNATSYSYDAAGRMLQASNPVTGTSQFAYDAVGNAMTMTMTDRTSGAAVTLASVGYDALDRAITQTVVTATATGLSGPALTTLTAYDLDGNVAQTVRPSGDIAYDLYNAADQLIGVEIDTAPLTKSQAATHATYESYGYDAAGNLTSFADSDGRSTAVQYDGDNHVTQGVGTSSGTGGTTVITTTAGYDPDGNTVSATTATQKGTDPVETHTSTSSYNPADWETATSDDGQTTSYGYDPAGQVRSESSGDGLTSATASYDPAGRITAMAENAGGAGPYTSQFTYTADDLPRTTTLPNGVHTTMGYDPNDELASLAAVGPNMGTITNTLNTTYAYGYDAAGWTISTTTISGTDTITHDASSRITDECGPQVITPNGCYHWTYDANGNVTSQITDKGTTETYTYSASQSNEVVQEHAPGYPDPDTYFAYDANGDVTAITAPVTGSLTDPAAINTHLSYDAEERPITVTQLAHGIPITAKLGYNADGLRDSYTVTMSGTATMDERFTYRDGQIAQVNAMTATLNADGSIKSSGAYTDTYLYGPDGAPLEFLRQQNGATARYWYVLDGQCSVVAVTDASGKVVDRYNYDSWGEAIGTANQEEIGTDYETVPQPLRYAGYWWDGELGWYWLSTRYYDPEDLHYLQPDPSDLDGVHTYVYVGDDPIDFVDPSGFNGNGIVNSVPQEIIDKMIQRVLDAWPTIVTPGAWDPPSDKRFIARYIGSAVHKEIGKFYADENSGDTVYTNYFPLSTILDEFPDADPSRLTEEQLRKRPDIVNVTRRYIYEIKRYMSYGAAVAQLKGYIRLFGKANVTLQPGPLNAVGTAGVVPAPDGYAAFGSPAPGVILYQNFKGKFSPRAAHNYGSADAAAKAAAAASGVWAILRTIWDWVTGGPPFPIPIPVPAGATA